MIDSENKSSGEQATAALLEASRAINSSLDLHQTLQAIAASAAKVAGAEGSSVLLLDSRRKKLIFKAAVGQRADVLLEEEFDSHLGIAGKVVTSGKAMRVADVSKNDDFYPGVDSKVGFQTRNLLCAPLVHQGQIIGVVEVLNRRNGNPFTEADLRLLEVFANLAAIGAVNAQRYESLKRENQSWRQAAGGSNEIIGSSAALQDVMRLCQRVAPSAATVLLLGESGTGKELIARAIHQLSPRRDKPFVAINCAALPEGLLESELFGHEKGSFTGATSRKLGRFELADEGTLFLDEIGDLSGAIQIKLLRVLQEKEFVRVGGTRTIATDVRIIAATNRDLKQAMQENRFREDLYYRLNVFPIEIAPLRDRREDIPALVEYFTTKVSDELKVPRPVVSDQALALLVAYNWPGNIRELRNVIERAVLLTEEGRITERHLPRELTGEAPSRVNVPVGNTLWDYERTLIVNALQQTDWNQSQAARALGISRDNLRYRIKKYGIVREGGVRANRRTETGNA